MCALFYITDNCILDIKKSHCIAAIILKGARSLARVIFHNKHFISKPESGSL
jgi:hypothetical protein